MYYICEKCGKVYEEDDIPSYTQKHYTLGGEYLGSEKYSDECCECGGELVEASECTICHEDFVKGYGVCEYCFEENCNLENCVEMGDIATEEIEINGFLLSVFTPSEIKECLLKEFNELPEQIKKDYIKNYCKDDISYFAEFLERKLTKC